MTKEDVDYNQMNGIALAYMGDAIYEIYIRRYLLAKGLTKPTKLHHKATHYVSAKAQAFYEDLQPEFTQYIDQVIKNSKAMAEEFKNSKNIRVVSGGTDNHLMIIDITKTGVTGKDAQNLLDSVNITTNKESIPGDKRSPFITSGLRIGTPAITSRGFKKSDAKEVAKIIIEVLDNPEDAGVLAQAKERVKGLIQRYPIK